MTKAQSASFARPNEVRDFDHGRLLVVNLGDEAVGRQVLEPGWRWSIHVQPLVGTARCEIHHIGLMLSGQLRAEMADGSVLEVGPDEVYELPPGHDAWVVGGEPAVSLHWSGIRTFGATAATSRRRVLTTVLFTDIVASTDVAARLGDERWQDLLATHNEDVRRVLDRFAGVEISTTGDGFLARFDTPARAIRCAEAIRAAIVGLGLEMRAAVHTGEVELVGDDISRRRHSPRVPDPRPCPSGRDPCLGDHPRSGRRFGTEVRGPWPPRAPGHQWRACHFQAQPVQRPDVTT